MNTPQHPVIGIRPGVGRRIPEATTKPAFSLSPVGDSPFVPRPHMVELNWVITYRCPRQCAYCMTDSGPSPPQVELEEEDKLRAVEILASQGIRRVSILGGEPFYLPELVEVVASAHAHGIATNITTSGFGAKDTVLDLMREGLEYVNVSVDGPEVYNDRQRGRGSFGAAIQMLELSRHVRIPVRIYAVVTTGNADEASLNYLFDLARRYSAVALMLIGFSPLGRGQARACDRPTENGRARYLELVARLSAQTGVTFKCADPFQPETFKVFLDSDGTVYKHAGAGVHDIVGHLHPAFDLWHALTESEQRIHWNKSPEYHPPAPRSDAAGRIAPSGMVYIPPGWFTMGGRLKPRELPLHRVYVDGLYMDSRQVTNRQYSEFLNASGAGVDIEALLKLESPTCLIEKRDGEFRPKEGFSDYPVVEVTWIGANAFAKWSGKRLPTEAEWEKAALGGADGRSYPWGDDPPGDQCNWLGYVGQWQHLRVPFHHGRGPMPVGMFRPNEFWLYDMAGNVWEWCQDWYAADAYRHDTNVNPRGPATGTKKILRGGSWSFDPLNLRIANRSYAPPEFGYSYDGFRCVISMVDWLLQERTRRGVRTP